MFTAPSFFFQDPLITFIRSSGNSSSSQRWTGKSVVVGLIAWTMIIVAGMVIFFRELETGGQEPLIRVFEFELLFGIGTIAMADVSTIWNSRINLVSETKAVSYGILGGICLVGMQFLIILGTMVNPFATNMNAELSIMAPVPEELFFTFVFYGTFRRIAPQMHWSIAALISSLIFAAYHFFVVGTQALPLLILFLGSMILKYLFEITQNIATSMIAHLVNNGVSQLGLISTTIAQYWWIVMIPILLIVIFVFCSGGRRK